MATWLEALSAVTPVSVQAPPINLRPESVEFKDAIMDLPWIYEQLYWTDEVDFVGLTHDISKQAGKEARKLTKDFPEVPVEALALEIFIILSLLAVEDRFTGLFHMPTYPRDAFSHKRTIKNVERQLYLCGKLGLDTERVCFRIFAIPAGFHACEKLSKRGIMTSATFVIAYPQIVRAALAGCTYIAPRLMPSFGPDNIKMDFTYNKCVYARTYYHDHGYDTEVMPEGHIDAHSCMTLAGFENLAVAPLRLSQLANPGNANLEEQDFVGMHDVWCRDTPEKVIIDDDADYEYKMSQVGKPGDSTLPTQAIRDWCQYQKLLEEHMAPFCKKSKKRDSKGSKKRASPELSSADEGPSSKKTKKRNSQELSSSDEGPSSKKAKKRASQDVSEAEE